MEKFFKFYNFINNNPVRKSDFYVWEFLSTIYLCDSPYIKVDKNLKLRLKYCKVFGYKDTTYYIRMQGKQ